MKARPNVRHTTQEKAIIAASNRVLANEAATPAEIATALKALERCKRNATDRAKANAKASAEQDPAGDVDTLVRELEKPAKAAAEPPAEPLDGLVQELARRAIPAQLEKPTPEGHAPLISTRCSDSDSVDDPRDTPNSIKPFQYDLALQATAKAAWEAQNPDGTHADLKALRNGNSDYDRSVEIWRQEIQNEQFERESLLRQIDQNRRKQSF